MPSIMRSSLPCIARLAMLCALMLNHSTPADASSVTFEDPQWSWSFDETHFLIEPSESVVIHATIYNDASSIMDMSILGVGAGFSGDLQKTFHFTFGPTGNSGDFGTDFIGLTIPPGGVAPFVFGILTPIGGMAPEGTYFADPAFLNFNVNGLFSGPRYSTNTFTVTVVAEPSLPLQMALGLFASAVGCRRFRMLLRIF
jgi:hypothetical protein